MKKPPHDTNAQRSNPADTNAQRSKSIVDDVQSDLQKVGGFFKKVWSTTERAGRGIEAARQDPEEKPEKKRRLPEKGTVVEAASSAACGVCGGTRIVGGAVKVACPACVKAREK